jgi:hypothetical protein
VDRLQSGFPRRRLPHQAFLRDALLGRALELPAASSAAAVATKAAAVAEQAPCKILLKTRRRQAPLPAKPDEQGWQQVQSRRARKLRRRQTHQPVPVDLRGKCFNCLSSTHRAAACQSRPRCFACHALGHRAYKCRSTVAQPARKTSSVWRRVSHDSRAPDRMKEPGAVDAEAGDGGGEVQPRRRRRQTRRRRGTGKASSMPPAPDGEVRAPPASSIGRPSQTPACHRPFFKDCEGGGRARKKIRNTENFGGHQKI